VWQFTMVWQRRIAQALRPLGVTQVQYALLASLLWLSKGERTVTQAQLARHAKLDLMMTSQVVRALEADRLLDRNAHPTDARAKVLTLTRKGRALAFRAVPIVEDADRAFFSVLGERTGKLNQLLIALIDAQT
jgi:DNA-binding MarR family transcriptional regulator